MKFPKNVNSEFDKSFASLVVRVLLWDSSLRLAGFQIRLFWRFSSNGALREKVTAKNYLLNLLLECCCGTRAWFLGLRFWLSWRIEQWGFEEMRFDEESGGKKHFTKVIVRVLWMLCFWVWGFIVEENLEHWEEMCSYEESGAKNIC